MLTAFRPVGGWAASATRRIMEQRALKVVLPMSRDARIPLTNLARLTDALARGLYLPVQLEGSNQMGFVVRLDDAPFGPVAVVHLPDGRFVRVLYRDPDDLVLITPDDSVRIQ